MLRFVVSSSVLFRATFTTEGYINTCRDRKFPSLSHVILLLGRSKNFPGVDHESWKFFDKKKIGKKIDIFSSHLSATKESSILIFFWCIFLKYRCSVKKSHFPCDFTFIFWTKKILLFDKKGLKITTKINECENDKKLSSRKTRIFWMKIFLSAA